MGWDDLAKLVHVVAAFGFVAGLVGRGVLLGRASRADDVEIAYQGSQATGPFEKLVIRSANLLLPAGLLTAWAHGLSMAGTDHRLDADLARPAT